MNWHPLGMWAGLRATSSPSPHAFPPPPLWHQSKVTAASHPDPLVIGRISAAAERGSQLACRSSFYYPVPPPSSTSLCGNSGPKMGRCNRGKLTRCRSSSAERLRPNPPTLFWFQKPEVVTRLSCIYTANLFFYSFPSTIMICQVSWQRERCCVGLVALQHCSVL